MRTYEFRGIVYQRVHTKVGKLPKMRGIQTVITIQAESLAQAKRMLRDYNIDNMQYNRTMD